MRRLSANRVVVEFTPELVAQLLGLPDTTVVHTVFTDTEDPVTHCFVLIDPAFKPVPEAERSPRMSLEDAIKIPTTEKENPHD